MKTYYLVNPESLANISKCFSGSEELEIFMDQLLDVTDEIFFQKELVKRVDEDTGVKIILKQICIISIFVREHMELIQQLISKIDSKSVSEEEMKKMQKE